MTRTRRPPHLTSDTETDINGKRGNDAGEATTATTASMTHLVLLAPPRGTCMFTPAWCPLHPDLSRKLVDEVGFGL